MTRPITFLTDYGHDDEFVGVCHGVLARLCPDARVLDITHGIPRQAVLTGALVLARALPYMPAGVHLAVVDPEVGARRRALALRLAEEERLLVGPDNGLLMPAAQRYGGVVEAVDISASPWRLEPVSATFHGRDVFAPVAAGLAAGEPLAAAGRPLDPGALVQLALPRPERAPNGALVAHVVAVDRFGNVALDATHADVVEAGLRVGRRVHLEAPGRPPAVAPFVRTFADARAGELLVYEDAAQALAIAVNTGDAAALLGLLPGDTVRLTPA